MSGQPTPPRIVLAFGANAGGGYINTPIPTASQIGITPGAASLQDGFPPLTMTAPNAGGVPPFGQDMNGILQMITAHIAALNAGQGYPFDATVSAAIGGYNLGAVLAMANGKGSWISTANSNTNNPDTANPNTMNWVPFGTSGVSAFTSLTNANVTLTGPQAAAPQILLSGTLTGNIQIIFPTWKQTWYVNNDTVPGAYSITCKTASGAGVVIPFGGAFILGDGTNISYATIARGQFTASYVGGTTAPGPTVDWTLNGNIVTLTLPTGVVAVSNSSSFSYTGLPHYLAPLGDTQILPLAFGTNNGANVAGAFAQLVAGTTSIVFGLLGATAGWTASGNKAAGGTFSYDLLAGV